jgi:four helix bundle protein
MEGDMRDYKKLRAWKEAYELALDVYRSTAAFPRDARYGITAQMRRASVSIPSNLAEGCGRESQKEMARFIVIAIGSANELEYQLLLGKDLEMLKQEPYGGLTGRVEGVREMLSGLLARVRKDMRFSGPRLP